MKNLIKHLTPLTYAILILSYEGRVAMAQEMIVGKIGKRPISSGVRELSRDEMIESIQKELAASGLDPMHLPTGAYSLSLGTFVPRVLLYVDSVNKVFRWENANPILRLTPNDLPDQLLKLMMTNGQLQVLSPAPAAYFVNQMISELKNQSTTRSVDPSQKMLFNLGYTQPKLYVSFVGNDVQWGYIDSPFMKGNLAQEILARVQQRGEFTSSDGSNRLIFQGPDLQLERKVGESSKVENFKLVVESKSSSGLSKSQGASTSYAAAAPNSLSAPSVNSINSASVMLRDESGVFGSGESREVMAASQKAMEDSGDGIQKAPEFGFGEIQKLFDETHLFRISLTWDRGWARERKEEKEGGRERITGDEKSQMYFQLSKKRMYALAFSDLVNLDREMLEREAQGRLGDGEHFELEIYFQRSKDELDYFGSENTREGEIATVRQYHHHPKNPDVSAYPLIIVALQRKMGEKVLGEKIIQPRMYKLYGPDFKDIVSGSQIAHAMKSL